MATVMLCPRGHESAVVPQPVRYSSGKDADGFRCSVCGTIFVVERVEETDAMTHYCCHILGGQWRGYLMFRMDDDKEGQS